MENFNAAPVPPTEDESKRVDDPSKAEAMARYSDAEHTAAAIIRAKEKGESRPKPGLSMVLPWEILLSKNGS